MKRLHFSPIQAVLFVILLAWSTLLIFYADGVVATQFGMILWDSLFDGVPLSFYGLANASGITQEGAVYDIGFYILYAIWQLPFYIIRHFVHFSLTAPLFIIWNQLLTLLFLFWSARLTEEIASLIGLSEEQCHLVGTLYVLSPLTFFPVFVAYQFDVIPLTFCLLATKYWLLRDRRKALLYFAISFLAKPFPVFWLMLYCVCENRRITYMIRDFVLGCTPMVIVRLLYHFSPAYPSARQAAQTQTMTLFTNETLDIGIGSISLFFAVVIVLYLYFLHRNLYSNQEVTEIVRRREIIIALWIMWFAFTILCDSVCYWVIYFAPFSVLILFLSTYDIENFLLDLVANAALVFIYILNYSWVYGGGRTYSYTFLQYLIPNDNVFSNGVTVAGLFRQLHLDQFEAIAATVAFVCFAVPGWHALQATRRQDDIASTPDTLGSRIAIWLRLAFLYGFVALTLAALYLSIKYRQ